MCNSDNITNFVRVGKGTFGHETAKDTLVKIVKKSLDEKQTIPIPTSPHPRS